MYSQEQYNEALSYYRQALDIYEKYYPTGHDDTAQTLNNIGLVLYQQEKYNEALDAHRRALKIRQQCHPTGDSSIVRNLIDISLNLIKQEKYTEAQKYYDSALQMAKKYNLVKYIDYLSNGNDNPRLLYFLNNSRERVARDEAACLIS